MGPPLAAPASVRGLERIYRDHHARVRWVLRARGVDEGQLDDLVHDVFLAIHRRLGNRSTDVPLVMWLDGVARNVAFSHRRSLGTRHRGEATLPVPEPARTPDDELALSEAWHALAQFLAELPLEQREVFVLVEMLGVSMADVAKDVEVPINTLYSRLRLARKRFGERFATSVADPAATQAFLRRAEHEARPSPATARRVWALIAIDIGHAAKAAGVGAMVGGLGGLAIAVGLVASIERPAEAPHVVQPVLAAGPRALASARATAPAAAPVIAPVIAEPIPVPLPSVAELEPLPIAPARSVRARRAAPPQSEPIDMRAEIEMLYRARKLVDRRPNDALALLDAYVAEFGHGVLSKEHFRIERDAACRAHLTDRARKAAAVLVTLDVHVRVDDPCTTK